MVAVMDLLQDHRRPLKVRKTTSGRWLMPVLEPVKLVSYGNLVLSALRTEEKGETKKEKEKKKDTEPVNWDRCAISMGSPRTRGRRPAPGNQEKRSHAGSQLTKSDERVQVFDPLL